MSHEAISPPPHLNADFPSANKMHSYLLGLPVELINGILESLDYKTLLTCMQVCKLLYKQIKDSFALRYQVQLRIYGMEDGPWGPLSAADRLTLLDEYTAAWKNLRWKSETVWPMLRGGVWELSGNVMAQTKGSHTVVFKELGAEIRRLKGKEWEYDVDVRVRDIGLDPAQDLLVIVETVTPDRIYHIHLRELSTGRPHPQAMDSGVLSHSPTGQNFSFAINICREHLAVMFISGDNSDSHLLIWNWRTAELRTHLRGNDLASFAFLTDRHLLVAVIENPLAQPPVVQLTEPSLIVVDFTTTGPESKGIWETDFICAFDYPTMQAWATALSILIRSDPAPSWRPHPAKNTPFHVAREDRLFVVTLWVAEGVNITSVVLLAPASTFLSKMATLAPHERKRSFIWNEWGPEGTRMRNSPTGHSMVWVCYVYGTKYIAPYRTAQALQLPLGPKQAQIFDFNQLAIKHALAHGSGENEDSLTHIMQEPSDLSLRGVFTEVIRTSLPYRWGHVQVPHQLRHTFDAVMLSEDAIITVTTKSDTREYRILSF